MCKLLAVAFTLLDNMRQVFFADNHVISPSGVSTRLQPCFDMPNAVMACASAAVWLLALGSRGGSGRRRLSGVVANGDKAKSLYVFCPATSVPNELPLPPPPGKSNNACALPGL